MVDTANEQNGHRLFRAFVSYSHADKAAAQKLHRKLEAYRLPKHLHRRGDQGNPDNRIGPIFRDREDLPAAEDLTQSVKQALAQSEALVVLCSPNAQKSPWVAREIELFRELHPDRPVLAALLEGEPEEAFPAPLREGREPLAADLRKEGDGPRLGFLKVVAGVAGVPLDALVNRDAQRRVKRVTAITVVAVTAMVVMALMTTFAIQQRNEARQQREAAEGLVEFMLGEHREELRKIGSVSAMASANRAALNYYENQDELSGFSDESLLSRAKGLHALGEDITTLKDGDLEQALDLFKQAHRSTKEILQRDPADADRVFSHAQSVYWVGYVDELRGDYDAAHAHYLKYQAMAEELSKLEPDSERTLMELGYGDLNLGIMSFRSKKFERANQEFSASIEWFAQALRAFASSDETRKQLANAYSWLSNSYYEQGNFRAALDAQENAANLKTEIYDADRTNLAARYDLLIARRALALARYNLGQVDLAQADLRMLVEETAALSALDPDNKEWADFAKKTRESQLLGRENNDANTDR